MLVFTRRARLRVWGRLMGSVEGHDARMYDKCLSSNKLKQWKRMAWCKVWNVTPSSYFLSIFFYYLLQYTTHLEIKLCSIHQYSYVYISTWTHHLVRVPHTWDWDPKFLGIESIRWFNSPLFGCWIFSWLSTVVRCVDDMRCPVDMLRLPTREWCIQRKCARIPKYDGIAFRVVYT